MNLDKRLVQLEEQRILLQRKLDASKDQLERNRLGQFATSPQLAKSIMRKAISLLDASCAIRYLEPGFGTGAFYSALLQSVPPSRVVAAVGYETDDAFARAAGELWAEMDLQVQHADFLEAAPPRDENSRYNLVVCNPPYVRHHYISKSQKSRLRSTAARRGITRLNGLSGLYAYFLVHSVPWMTRGGVGAWLIPREFMDVNYGREVKRFLAEQVMVESIHCFDPHDVQFDDALVSSAVILFRNQRPPDRHKTVFSLGGTFDKPLRARRVDVRVANYNAKWSHLAVSRASGPQLTDELRLSDLFRIKRGVATGANKFFILSEQEIARRDLPYHFFTPILPSPRHLETDEIHARTDGSPNIRRRLFLLSCDLPESEVRTEYPKLWRYLEEGKSNGLDERYLIQSRNPWYSQEKRPSAPILCTYMGRQTAKGQAPFRFIINYSKATAPNVYLMLYPKPLLAQMFDNNLARVLWSALSRIASSELVSAGRVYGGGLYKLEPRELAGISAAELITAATRNGSELPRGQMQLLEACLDRKTYRTSLEKHEAGNAT